MSVTIKCERPFSKNSLKQIIESCGYCPPMDPQCPPCSTSCPPQPICYYTYPAPACKLEPKSNCCPPMSVTCMPTPSLLFCPFVRPPCTDRIISAPIPKPVSASYEAGSVLRAPVTTGGLFYIGTIR